MSFRLHLLLQPNALSQVLNIPVHAQNDLFYQILSNIYDIEKENTPYKKFNGCNISVYLPPNIAIELEAKYDFYCKAFKKDLEAFYYAFVNANELWSCSGYVEESELTDEVRETRKKAKQLSNSLDPHHFNKQLEYKG